MPILLLQYSLAMKSFFLLILFLSIFEQHAQSMHSNPVVEEIDSLINVKSYFKARKVFNMNVNGFNDFETFRLKATICNLFNNLEESTEAIDKIFRYYKDSLSREQAKDLLNVKLSNAVKLFEYKSADEMTNILVRDYKDAISKDQIESTLNNGIIWKAISNYPKQTVQFTDESYIKLIRDRAGLKNIEVEVDSKKHSFILDTGANLSTTIESQAMEMGLKIIDVAVSVGTITGKVVNSKIGIASNLKIDNMIFDNVVFLVFPDEALYISQIDYQIKGILGYPILSAMKEIHFFKNDSIYVPLKSSLKQKVNLAIEYLTPIINLEDKSRNEMHFTFDTGADNTMLYKSYYDLKKEEILDRYAKTKIRFGGAGGNTQVDGYNVNFELRINGSIVNVDSVSVIPKLIKASDQFSYGNIGQDLISKFEKMVLNFEKMFIHFE